jgi:predicted dehydrogenase
MSFASSVKNEKFPSGKDYINAFVEFENGVSASFTASRITQSRVRTLNVTTSNNYYDMDFINQSIAVHSQGRMHGVNQNDLPENMRYGLKGSIENLFIMQSQPLASELTHFANCINNNENPRITGEQALNALKVIWEVQKAINSTSAIHLAAE